MTVHADGFGVMVFHFNEPAEDGTVGPVGTQVGIDLAEPAGHVGTRIAGTKVIGIFRKVLTQAGEIPDQDFAFG